MDGNGHTGSATDGSGSGSRRLIATGAAAEHAPAVDDRCTNEQMEKDVQVDLEPLMPSTPSKVTADTEEEQTGPSQTGPPRQQASGSACSAATIFASARPRSSRKTHAVASFFCICIVTVTSSRSQAVSFLLAAITSGVRHAAPVA